MEAGAGQSMRVFFIHVMKTGGGSFTAYLKNNIPLTVCFPTREEGVGVQRFLVSRLRDHSAERRASILAYTGHWPAAAVDLVDQPVLTMTILRDPVERIISYVRQSKRLTPEHAGLSYEEIYDDPFHFPALIHNHQAKVFALPPTAESYLDPLELTPDRLDVARRRLEAIDIIGLQHRHAEFTETVGRRLGWREPPKGRRNVAPPDEPFPESLRRRIEADNQADIAFYNFALDLCGEAGVRELPPSGS